MNKDLFTPELLDVYTNRYRYAMNHASNDHKQEGMVWYQQAHNDSEKIAVKVGADGETVRKVLTAISPRNNWESSLVQTEQLFSIGAAAKISTFNANKDKALRCIADAGYLPFSFASGAKTFCFFDNMNAPDTSDLVTLDVHAITAFGLPYGNIPGTNGKKQYPGLTVPQYHMLSNCVRIVAAEHGIMPHQVQAIVWLRQRFGHLPVWSELVGCI